MSRPQDDRNQEATVYLVSTDAMELDLSLYDWFWTAGKSR